MERLKEIVQKGLAGAAEAKAFANIEAQPAARTLVGLLIGQGRSFERAQKARRQVLAHLADQKIDTSSDTKVWKALCEITESQWEEWGVPSTVYHTIHALQPLLKQHSIHDLIRDDSKHLSRIGPWTRKAFLIMTASDAPPANNNDLLLTEDPWVRQRWSMIIRAVQFTGPIPSLSVATCRELGVHPIDLSRLLWRLSKDGVRRLVQPKSRIHQSTTWFI